jgi:hypothetical protein
LPICAIAAALTQPASASDTVYQYRIEHPRYGDIGTYANIVKADGDRSEVDTELHILVKILGIVMYREDAKRTEHWDKGRLVAFQGVTETNGTRIEIHGEAQGDHFVVTTPTGVINAPARVHPSNPWASQVLDTDTMMSAKTGRVDKVTVSGGDVESVTFGDKSYLLHRWEIDGTKRQFVWLNDRGVPVAMRTEEDGTPIDFVLSHATESNEVDGTGAQPH